MFPATAYDPETLGVLTRVFDEAWIDIQAMLVAPPLDASAMRSALAKAHHGSCERWRARSLATEDDRVAGD